MISTHNPCVHGKHIHRTNQILQPELFLNHLNLLMPIPSIKSFSIYLYVCYEEIPSRAAQGHCQATHISVKRSFFPRLMHQLQAVHTQHSLMRAPLTHPCSPCLPDLLVRRSTLPASSHQEMSSAFPSARQLSFSWLCCTNPSRYGSLLSLLQM